MELQDQYFKKATEAYENKDYKYCLILLRKLDLTDYKTVGLLVNCSYDYWKATVISTAESRAVSRATSRAVSRSGSRPTSAAAITNSTKNVNFNMSNINVNSGALVVLPNDASANNTAAFSSSSCNDNRHNGEHCHFSVASFCFQQLSSFRMKHRK